MLWLGRICWLKSLTILELEKTQKAFLFLPNTTPFKAVMQKYLVDKLEKVISYLTKVSCFPLLSYIYCIILSEMKTCMINKYNLTYFTFGAYYKIYKTTT